MRAAVCMLIAAVAFADTSAPNAAKSAPLLAAWLAERGPLDGTNFLGPPQPSFFLREDGLVIFTRKVGRQFQYYSAQLRPDEVAALMASLPPRPAFQKLKAYYDLSPRFGQLGTESLIAWFHDGAARCVSVTGLLAEDCPLHSPPEHGGCVRPTTPPVFLRLWDRLVAFDSARAVPWQPERFHVRLVQRWDDEKTLPWPAGVPSDSVRLTAKDDLRDVVLDGKHLPALRRLMAEAGIMGLVHLDDKNWAVAIAFDSPLPAPATLCNVKK